MNDSSTRQSMLGSTTDDQPLVAMWFQICCWCCLSTFFVYGIFLRASGISDAWVNPDEGIYYSMAASDSWTYFWNEWFTNAHPPLFYLLIRVTYSLLPDVTAMRLVSVVSGSLCIPAVFALCVELGQRTRAGYFSGLFAAVAVAVSPVCIWTSHAIRPYPFLVLMLMVSLYFLFRYQNMGKRKSLVLYAIFGLLALLTHYSAVLLFAAIGCSLLVLLMMKQIPRKQAVELLLANLPLVLCVLAMYVFHVSQLKDSDIADRAWEGWLTEFLYDGVWRAWFGLAGTWAAFTGTWLFRLATIVFLLSLGYLAWNRIWGVALLPLFSWLIASVVAAMGVYPFGCARHVMYLFVPLVIPIAHAFGHVVTGRRVALVYAVVVLVVMQLSVTHLSLVRYRMFPAGEIRIRLVEERPVERADMQAVLPMLNEVIASRNVILMAPESYYSFMPLYDKGWQHAQRTSDGVLDRFRWDENEVIVVNNVWQFDRPLIDPADQSSISHTLQEISLRFSELQIHEDRRVWIFFAGWYSKTPRDLIKEGEDRGYLKRHVSEGNVFLIEIDTQAYQKAVQEIMHHRSAQ